MANYKVIPSQLVLDAQSEVSRNDLRCKSFTQIQKMLAPLASHLKSEALATCKGMRIDCSEIDAANDRGILCAIQKFDATKKVPFNFFVYKQMWGCIMDDVVKPAFSYVSHIELTGASTDSDDDDVNDIENDHVMHNADRCDTTGYDMLVDEETRRWLMRILKKELTKLQYNALVNVYGLDGHVPMKTKEYAAKTGTTDANVSYLVNAAIKKLQKHQTAFYALCA